MFDVALLHRRSSINRVVKVGWALDKASFIWEAPTRLGHEERHGTHAKSVSFCPAVIDHEARIFQIHCPFDMQVSFEIDPNSGQPRLRNMAGDMSSIRPKTLSELIHLNAPGEWRHPKRPILQIRTPYLFVADELTYMTQLPAFNHCPATRLPGLMIGGRLPIHVWPRPLMWAFEWHDTSKELVLKRGEPWFYVRFEFQDPSRSVRMIEADLTPQLREYVQGLSAVTNYVSRTFSLFEVARSRRPKTLLVEKRR